MKTKTIFQLLIFFIVVVAFGTLIVAKPTHAYTQSHLIDNDIFDNASSMNEAQIRSFLNQWSSSCLVTSGASFSEPVDYWTYGPNNVDAARVIYLAAQYSGINPQVIITTLQKEQSLITRTSCYDGSIDVRAKAMGMGCSEGGTCPPPTYAGFEKQVMKGAWQLAFNRQRAEGNTGWGENDSIVYSGQMTRGTFRRCGSCALVYFDGYASPPLDGQSIFIETAATASLYTYTPHLNQSFPSIFTNWFGSTDSSLYYACHNATNVAGAAGGGHIVPRKINGGADNLTLVLDNNTASACIEMHTWSNNTYQTWYQNIATNHPTVNPADDEVITADTNGDGKDEFYLVKLRNSQSGMIEIHEWDSTNQHWLSNLATNHPAVNPADDRVIATDLDGDGRDEFTLIKYRNSVSGKIEVHTWGPGEQSWLSHIATNMPSVDPADDEIIAANTVNDGDKIDKLILVKYRNSVSGKIEVHTWLPGEQGWYSNLATNHPAVNPADDEVITADTNGDGKDELLLIKYRNSVSGKIEVHTWGPEQQSWLSNLATNLPVLAP